MLFHMLRALAHKWYITFSTIVKPFHKYLTLKMTVFDTPPLPDFTSP